MSQRGLQPGPDLLGAWRVRWVSWPQWGHRSLFQANHLEIVSLIFFVKLSLITSSYPLTSVHLPSNRSPRGMAVSRLQVAGYPRSWTKYTWIMWQKGETRHRGRRGFSQQLRVSGFHPCPLWVLRENGYRPPIRLVFHSDSATLAVDPIPQPSNLSNQLWTSAIQVLSSPKLLYPQIFVHFTPFFFFFLALLM